MALRIPPHIAKSAPMIALQRTLPAMAATRAFIDASQRNLTPLRPLVPLQLRVDTFQLRTYASQPNPMDLFNSAFFRKISANPSAMMDFQEITVGLAKRINPTGKPNFQPSATDLFKLMMDSGFREEMVKLKNTMDKCGIDANDLQEISSMAQKMMGTGGQGGPVGASADSLNSIMSLLGAPAAAPAKTAPRKAEIEDTVDAEVVEQPRRTGSKRFLPPRPPPKREEEGEIVGEEKEGSGFLGKMRNIFGGGKS